MKLASRPGLGMGLLVAAIVVSVAAYRAEPDPSLRPWPVLLLWIGSIVLFLGASGLLARPETTMRIRIERWEVAFLLSMTFAALLLRVLALDRVPGNFSGDEGEMGEMARSVLSGDLRDPFTTGWLGHPTLWFFLQALSLDVIGNSVIGLRALSALIGTATVPLLYLFARFTFGRSIAVVATTLLAAYHFHIHFSRIGLNNIADPALMLLAVGALIAGLRTRSPLAFACAGVAAGIAQLFYYGTRLVPLVLVVTMVHQLLVARPPTLRSARYLPLAAIGFLIGYGPGVRIPLFHWDDYAARLPDVGIFQSGWFDERRALGESGVQILVQQSRQAVGAFTHVADSSGFYSPGMPLLDSVSAVFFVVGVAVLLARWRRPETAAVASWVAGTILTGGILLVDPPQSQRYITTAPAVCLLAAIGIVRTTGVVKRRVPHGRAVAPAAAALLVAALALWSVNFYFFEYSSRNTYGYRRTEVATAVARYIDAHLGGTFVYFFGPPFTYLNNGSIRFLAPDLHGVDVPEPLLRGEYLPRAPGSLPPSFVLLPGRLAELPVVRAAYPAGRVHTVFSEHDRRPLFYTYEVASPDPGTGTRSE
jgi:4-amino-4-deoxy-L-arabinose transferase-like glycosyltransferase